MEKNSLNMGTFGDRNLLGASDDTAKTILTRRDWEDDFLPPNVETFSFKTVFKKYKNYKDPSGEILPLAELEGLGFGIPREKLESVGAQPGDELRVEKMASDGSYHGDGIVKLTNLSKGVSATIKDWELGRAKKVEEIRKAQ